MACIAKQSGNIVVVCTNYFGLEPVEAQWFQDLGVQHRELSLLSWGELRSKYKLRSHFLKKLFARILFLPASIFIRFYQFFLFFRLLKNEKPDLIVGANGGYPAGGAVNRFILVGALQNIRCFYSIVNVPSQHWWDKIRMVVWDRILPKISEKVIIDSKEIKKQLTEHHFSNEKMVILYNGLKGTIPYNLRQNKKIKILYFARMEEIKGIEYLDSAIRILNVELASLVEFHFYGDGTLSPIIKKLASDFSSNIFFHGFFEGDFQPIFSNSDIYVLPSLMEGLPYTVLEAMKTGCCIVSSEVGGLTELVKNGVSGILVQPKNVVDLSAALKKVILNSELRISMGKAAKEKFDLEFEQSAIFRMHSGLFEL
jgi:glycosyltransferase involved in cell wall biosynthesis